LDGRCRTDQRTQGQGCLTTDPAEITETHYGNEWATVVTSPW
jgi:hypothetical protein